jgi:hypothetical protein
MTHAYAGQHGATRYFINKTSSISWSNIENEPATLMLGIDIAAETNFGDNIGSVYKAWFVPPKTTKYRFYMVCDDYCSMKLGQCPKS